MVAAAALAAALAAAWLPASARAGASCPQIACDKYVRNASWTGRFAIVVSGHVRMAHDQLPTLKRIVAANGGREKVDVVYHVWHNSSAPCEVASLAELEGFAAVVTTEPWACMWSVARRRRPRRRAARGSRRFSKAARERVSPPFLSRARSRSLFLPLADRSYGKGWENQWHGVDRALRTLELHARGDLSKYTLVLKTRADVVYRHTGGVFSFADVWARCGAARARRRRDAARARRRRRAAFPRARGHDAETPPLLSSPPSPRLKVRRARVDARGERQLPRARDEAAGARRAGERENVPYPPRTFPL